MLIIGQLAQRRAAYYSKDAGSNPALSTTSYEVETITQQGGQTQQQPRKEKTNMARGMVTRTVKGTSVEVKVVDAATEQIVQETVMLPKSYDDEAKLKKAVTKAIPEGKILVSIVSSTEVNKCYGVPTAKFMELAVELDPEKRTALETEDEAE